MFRVLAGGEAGGIVLGGIALVSVAAVACSAPKMDVVGTTSTLRAGAPTDGAQSAAGTSAAPAPDDMQLFLLIGQSNMEGIPKPEPLDLEIDPRVWVLGYDDGCLGRGWNEWAPATPPLHRCWAGVGPGDWFAKTLIESWPEAKIGLIPAAISGAPIDLYTKGVVSHLRDVFDLPPDDAWIGAHEMTVSRAKVAQRRGTIRGILFHQGEADVDNAAWPQQVAQMVVDLESELGLPDDLPFIAGELVPNGCCAVQNPRIDELPMYIPNAHIVSSAGLSAIDAYHFDLAGQRELGRRYARAFLDAISR